MLAAVNAVSASSDVSADFDVANRLYEQGKFSEAAAAYGRIVQSGSVSAPIYFNLGNAFFKAGQAGRAIAAYRAAETIAPRDPEVRANLQFVRSRVQGPTAPPPAWVASLGRLSLNEWAILAAALFWLWLLLLAAQQLRPSWKGALRAISILAGCATLTAALCLGTLWHHTASDRSAIVDSETVTARTGPFDEAQTAFVAHDGAELEAVDDKNGWVQVRAGDRQVGWIKREQLIALKR